MCRTRHKASSATSPRRQQTPTIRNTGRPVVGTRPRAPCAPGRLPRSAQGQSRHTRGAPSTASSSEVGLGDSYMRASSQARSSTYVHDRDHVGWLLVHLLSRLFRMLMHTPSGSRPSHTGTHRANCSLKCSGDRRIEGKRLCGPGMFDVRVGPYKARRTDSAVGAREGARSGQEHRQGRTFGGGEETDVSFPHGQAP
jgi:hypothetical protein